MMNQSNMPKSIFGFSLRTRESHVFFILSELMEISNDCRKKRLLNIGNVSQTDKVKSLYFYEM